MQLPSLKPSRRSAVVAHAAAAYPFKKKDARLVLEDGSVWQGTAFGATGTEVGEVVFNTSITGYQEIMTDPSYKGQFVCFTHPHIGNVGVNDGAQGTGCSRMGQETAARGSWGFALRTAIVVLAAGAAAVHDGFQHALQQVG